MSPIDELQKRIDELIQSIGLNIGSAENDIRLIVYQILDYYSYRGVLRSDNTDFKLLRDLEFAIDNAITKSGYFDDIQKLIDTIEEIETVTKETIVQTNKKVDFTADVVNLTQEKKMAIDGIVSRLSAPEAIKINITLELKQVIYRSIKSGVTLQEAKNAISPLIVGDSARGGSLSRYYGTIATDTLNQFQGVVSQEVSNSYGLIDFMYAGELKTTSRPQCIRWAGDMGGRLVKEIVEFEMKRALPSVRRSNDLFKGYSVYAIPSVANFPIIRGGHNCRHTAIPYLAEVEEADQIIKKFNGIYSTMLLQKYKKFRE